MRTNFRNTKNRWLPLALMAAISCAAEAQPPQQMAADWPREISAGGSTIVVYEPQLESFRGSRMITRAAVSLTRENAAEPVFGGLWLDAVVSTDADRRTVTPVVIKVSELRFPGLSADEAARLRVDIGDEVSRWHLTYSVDTLLAEVKLLEEQKAAADNLKADVPQIFFRNAPAVLLGIQDEPAWGKSSDSAYQRLQNASLFVLRENSTGLNYLHLPPFWWTAAGPLGPWQAVDTVPDAVSDVWKNEPQRSATESGPRPEVIAVSGAAELVWTDGAPQYSPITGTNLLYIRNTDSDVFLDIQTQMTYALFSGRWYRTPQGKSAWEFVASDKLPPDFARIPITSEKRHVLACVSGTIQAEQALKNAEIPQTEAVKPGLAPDLQATYDGEPQFTDIPDIGLSYAVNTPYSIFHVPGRYYWCYDGIWYDSQFPIGPWYVCVGVPRAIYLIPPSCPHYYVTYCHIFGVSSHAVYVGYYPGYRGCYAWGGSVVYGTGWHYRPWIGTQCYTRPVTWGLGVTYSAGHSGWSMQVGVGVRDLGVHRPAIYRNPAVQPGAGGYWGNGVHDYRSPSASTPSANPHSTLYDRHPDRIASPPPSRPTSPLPERPTGRPLPPETSIRRPELPSAPRPPREEPGRPIEHDLPRPEQPRQKDPLPPRDVPKTPPSQGPRDSKASAPPPQRQPEAPRHQDPPPPPPRREAPRRPDPPPAPSQREAPRHQDPPPRREPPKDGPRSSDRKH